MINKFEGMFHFLSNMQLIDIPFEGIVYPSVEHYYVAMKTTDPRIRRIVSKIETPEKAKKYGRRDIEEKGLLRPDWSDIKIDVMRKGLEIKFQDVFMQTCLMETDDHELIEGNWWNDTFWGVYKGKGENNLGKLLMEIRQRIRNENTQILP